MGKSTINGPFSIAMLNYQRVRIDWSDFWGGHPKNAPFHTLPGKTHQFTGPLSTAGVSHTQAPASPVPGASETPSQMNTEKLEGQLINRAYRAYPMCNTQLHWEYHDQPVDFWSIARIVWINPKLPCIKESCRMSSSWKVHTLQGFRFKLSLLESNITIENCSVL